MESMNYAKKIMLKQNLLEYRAPFSYSDTYRKKLLKFKFKGAKSLGLYFSLLMAETAVKFDRSFDIISYVPMTKKAVRKRGYNQSEILARGLSRYIGIPVVKAINKTKNNLPQRTLDSKQRKENVKGAFSVCTEIKGKSVLLVDDIITTGSTISECAGILYDAGASSVYGICAADAEFDKERKNSL